MSSTPQETSQWDEFVSDVLRPQGLARGLNGDTDQLQLKKFFDLRSASARGDQEAQQKILRWNQEMERINNGFFQRTDQILGAITDFFGRKEIRPGMKTRGGWTR